MSTPSRIAALLKASPYSNSALSEKTGIALPRLSMLLKGASPTINELLLISKVLDVGIHRLVEWEIESDDIKSLPLVNAEAVAGFIDGHSDPAYLEKLESYRIPGFKGNETLLFKVHGHSMYPSIAEDDYLVCQKLTDKDEMDDQGIAVVMFGKQLLVKRVIRENNHWILRSDNPEFDDEEVKKKELTVVWKVIGKVTSDFLKSSKEDFERIARLKEELRKLKAEMELCQDSFAEVSQKLKNKNINKGR